MTNLCCYLHRKLLDSSELLLFPCFTRLFWYSLKGHPNYPLSPLPHTTGTKICRFKLKVVETVLPEWLQFALNCEQFFSPSDSPWFRQASSSTIRRPESFCCPTTRKDSQTNFNLTNYPNSSPKTFCCSPSKTQTILKVFIRNRPQNHLNFRNSQFQEWLVNVSASVSWPRVILGCKESALPPSPIQSVSFMSCYLWWVNNLQLLGTPGNIINNFRKETTECLELSHLFVLGGLFDVESGRLAFLNILI